MNLYIPAARRRGQSRRRPPVLPLLPHRAGDRRGARRGRRAEGLTFYWYSPTPALHLQPHRARTRQQVLRGHGRPSLGLARRRRAPLLLVSPPHGKPAPRGLPRHLVLGQGPTLQEKAYAPAECAGCESFTACQAACPLYWDCAGTAEIRNHPRPRLKEEAMEMKFAVPKLPFAARLALPRRSPRRGGRAVPAARRRRDLPRPARHGARGRPVVRCEELPQQADGHRPRGLAARHGRGVQPDQANLPPRRRAGSRRCTAAAWA